MTSHDALASDLAAWFDAEAQAPIPARAVERALAATVDRRPRPARLASLGSRWITDASSATATFGRRGVELPVLRSRYAIPLLLLLVVLLAAAAALIGSRSHQRPHTPGSLAYALDGDIYLADADGTNAKLVADGAPSSGAGARSYEWGDRPVWAPDGRHFLFFDMTGPDGAQQVTGHIADSGGRVVASIPGIWVDATWSPDSTRLQAWTDGIGSTRIGIYGIDGVRQRTLPVPDGQVRFLEYGGVWAPDGLSVWVRTSGGIWQLPIDGSVPRALAADDLLHGLFDLTFSRDGARGAGTSGEGSLLMADADGTALRPLTVGSGTGGIPGEAHDPMWSPRGTEVAFVSVVDAQTFDIRVIDLPGGTDHTLRTGVRANGYPLLGWSPAGDRILFRELDDKDRPSLWSMNADGGDGTLLVDGASSGEWQWVPTPQAGPVETPSATPPPQPSAPESVPDVAPVLGALHPGTYTYGDVDRQGFNVRFTVPAGWTWNGRYLSKGGVGQPGGAAIYFFGGPVQVYADPCHWAGPQPSLAAGLGTANVVVALAAQPLRSATTPIDRPAGGLGGPGGWPGTSLQLTVPDDLNLAGCDAGQFRSWGPANNARINQGPGQRDLVWVVYIGGAGVDNGPGATIVYPPGGLIIDAASFPGTPTEVMSEIQAILDSIVVGHWG